MLRRKFGAAAAVAAASALVLAACGGDDSEPTDPGDDGTDEGAASDGSSLIFGTAGEALTLDPTYSSDGETMRVSRQIYDTLVMLEPGTTDIVPGLAESYEPDETGTVWTFNLREGVTFHDGTEFNAEAVCFNYDRWHNLTGLGQDPSMSYYWQFLSGGFANNEPDRDDLGDPNFVSCEAVDELTAVITLQEPSSKFPGLTSLPTFAMHSPTALQEMNADDLGGTADAVEWSEYSLEGGVGTGPFKFDSWDRANQEITLVRNDDYWGEPAKVERLIFKAIPDETARFQELAAGNIDGYDLPAPADWAALEEEGMNVEIRDAVNVLYLAFTQGNNEDLDKIEVRRAIGHALNREAMIAAVMPEGAEVATQFQPPILPGWNADIAEIEYDPELAQQLLAENDAEDLEVNFYWPTDVTRPYMPDPQTIFELFQADLEAVGITVNPVSEPWTPEYLADVQEGEADLHLLGWTADFADGYNFIGTWFERPLPQWGITNQDLFDAMVDADSTPDMEERIAKYEALNAMIMEEELPGIPISHTPPGIALSPDVTGLAVSPLQDERFFQAEVNR